MILTIKQRFHEVLLICLASIAIYLFISLFTYHRLDASWSTTGVSSVVRNAGGAFGAWFSDIFFSLFGYMAYLFPLLFLLPCFTWFKTDLEEMNSRQHLSLKSAGFVLTLLSGDGLMALFWHPHLVTLPVGTGGMVGKWVRHPVLVISMSPEQPLFF